MMRSVAILAGMALFASSAMADGARPSFKKVPGAERSAPNNLKRFKKAPGARRSAPSRVPSSDSNKKPFTIPESDLDKNLKDLDIKADGADGSDASFRRASDAANRKAPEHLFRVATERRSLRRRESLRGRQT